MSESGQTTNADTTPIVISTTKATATPIQIPLPRLSPAEPVRLSAPAPAVAPPSRCWVFQTVPQLLHLALTSVAGTFTRWRHWGQVKVRTDIT